MGRTPQTPRKVYGLHLPAEGQCCFFSLSSIISSLPPHHYTHTLLHSHTPSSPPSSSSNLRHSFIHDITINDSFQQYLHPIFPAIVKRLLTILPHQLSKKQSVRVLGARPCNLSLILANVISPPTNPSIEDTRHHRDCQELISSTGNDTAAAPPTIAFVV